MLKVTDILKATNGKLINGNKELMITNYKIDSREVNNGDFFIPLSGEKTDGHKYLDMVIDKGCCGFFVAKDKIDALNIKEYLIKNKNLIIIEVEDTLIALHSIGEYNRDIHISIPIVAVTGSVGKTSTREIISSVLSQEKKVMTTEKNMNGNIGLPLMTLKLQDQDVGVFEAGVDFVGEMDILTKILKPEIAVITNIGTSHIGKFGSKDIIYQEKTKIANGLVGRKILLLNKDDEYLKNYKNDNVNIEFYSINDAKNIKMNNDYIEFDTYIYNKLEHLKINDIGEHNVLNSLIAIKIGQLYNISSKNIIKGIDKYRNFSRRMEKIKIKDFTIIDDTYNASPSSTESGLKTLSNLNYKRKIAVLADILELGEYSKKIHEDLGECFKGLNIDVLIAYGDAMKYLVNNARKYVSKVFYFNNEKEVIEKIESIIQKDDIIYFKGSNAMNVNKIIEHLKEDFMN